VSHFSEIIETINVRCHLPAASRKRALQLVAQLLADDLISEDLLFDSLMARERLGSTALGEGVALPHCRIKGATTRGALVSLPEPVNFEAGDSEPVDLLFVLIVSEEETTAHLEALSVLARIFSMPQNRSCLRACSSDETLLSSFLAQLTQQGQGPGALSA